MIRLTVVKPVPTDIPKEQVAVTLDVPAILKCRQLTPLMSDQPTQGLPEIPEDGEDLCCDLPHSTHSSSAPLLHQELLSNEKAQRMAEFFGFLADPNRWRIISLLAKQEICVGDLAATLGMKESAVSHQLRTLRAIRMVSSRKQGRHVFYRLQDHHVLNFYEAVVEHLDETEP